MVHLLELLGVGLAFKSVLIIGFVLAFMSRALAFPNGDHSQPCDNVPPITAQRPITVVPTIVDLHDSEMAQYCQKDVPITLHIFGCAFPKANPPLIFMNDLQTDTEYACTLLYEDAHLPPNNWSDPVMEAGTPDRR